jgi:Trypsin
VAGGVWDPARVTPVRPVTLLWLEIGKVTGCGQAPVEHPHEQAACSGTLIAPTVFLTAAHCDLGVSRVAVTFDGRYGAQSVTIDHGPSFHYADVRYVATGGLLAVTPSWLRISMNPARGDGGGCYGDSGGPNFSGAGDSETDIVAAITITGDAMCRATNVTYSLDTPSARAFLGQYVTLP